MAESLDNILSGQSDAVSEQVEENNAAQAVEGEGQQQQIDPEEVQATEVNGQKMVPHAALHASKEKVKRYTDQVAEFEKSMGGVREQNAMLTRQVTELLQRIPQQPKAEPQQPPDQFEDFPGATRHVVQPEFDDIRQTVMANAQLIAGVKYGDDKVAEAEQAFIGALQGGKLSPKDPEYQKVITSPNRYAAAVQWHQRQVAQAEIGPDPAAYRAKLEAELREKITAELQQGDGQQAQQRQAPVMPSNLAGARNVGARSGPAWSGPSTLQDIFDRARPSG